jgi:hypothetical protein
MGRNASLQREQFARCFGVNLAKARSAADVSQDELAFRTRRTARRSARSSADCPCRASTRR